MSEIVKTLYTEEQIQNRIMEIAASIVKDCGNEPLHLIGVLRGAAPFANDLSRALYREGLEAITIDYIKVSSYDGSQSTGNVKGIIGLSEKIADRNVMIVEDIIDTGHTLQYLLNKLQEEKPKSIKTCSLLDKSCRREIDISADYIGFEIPDVFVVGYGLDYQQRYREIPKIVVLAPEIVSGDKLIC